MQGQGQVASSAGMDVLAWSWSHCCWVIQAVVAMAGSLTLVVVTASPIACCHCWCGGGGGNRHCHCRDNGHGLW